MSFNNFIAENHQIWRTDILVNFPIINSGYFCDFHRDQLILGLQIFLGFFNCTGLLVNLTGVPAS
jgi:hypothetical protein